MNIRYKYVLKIRYKDNEAVQVELYNMKYTFEQGKTTPLNYFCLCNFKCDLFQQPIFQNLHGQS